MAHGKPTQPAAGNAGADPHPGRRASRRSRRLLSRRTRRSLFQGLTRVLAERPGAAFSPVIAADQGGVELARPALEQLARALRDRPTVDPRGLAVLRWLLTEPCSPLFHPGYPEQLYELAREALLALGPDERIPVPPAPVPAPIHEGPASTLAEMAKRSG